MASSLLPDLLLPIAEDRPCGTDLREDTSPQSIYFQLRDARSTARAAERLADNGAADRNGASSHWTNIRSLAVQALSTDTKDLEIATWLTESLVRSDGLSGLAAGATLLAGLVEQFWDAGLYPALDDDGADARLASVGGLSGQGSDGTLMQPLRKLLLFTCSDGATVSLWQFQQAEDVAGIGDAEKRAQRITMGAPELGYLETEARGSGAAALGQLLQEVTAALMAWEALHSVLSDKAAQAAPNNSRVRDLLSGLQRLAKRYVTSNDSAASAPADTIADQPEPARQSSPSLSDRETLLTQINDIAAHFRLNEPNSPLGYTLDEAVRRARLSWPELLREVLPEEGARVAMMTGLGLRSNRE